ncbi:MAG TPA: hydroxyacid dehydrogenase [Atribacteraceae bacterium]|nr:hydroxyacid dehydrogenase [Atribacteraceae bacterium]
MKMAFFETKPFEQQFLENHLKNHETNFFEVPLTDEILDQIQDVEVLSPFIYSELNRRRIEALPRLRLVATRSTGFDHIDLAACQGKNITVSNVPLYGENTVAEHTFALILALSRNIHRSYLRTSEGNFSIDGLKGFDLEGKVLGVVGTGRIGVHVIKIARGFGMSVLANDVKPNEILADVMGFTYVSFEDLLERSDIISLHVPLTSGTRHLINAQTLQRMKQGGLLINTSRGGLVDTEALIRSLDDKWLRGAGLDVLEGEEFIREDRELLADKKSGAKKSWPFGDVSLLRREDLVLTPHIAFFSNEALQRILDTTLTNIEAFLEGIPKNTIHG